MHRSDEIGVMARALSVLRDNSRDAVDLRLEQEKHQAQKMDSLGSLAGGVAHDFNNMLAGIMGYADLLLARETDPVRQKYLQAILSSASRSAELTQKLLAFGRRGKNRVESINLATLIEECLVILQPSMAPDLRVVMELDHIPTVDGDPSQIHQALLNLCINAVEAMPGHGTLSLSTRPFALEPGSLAGFDLDPGAYVEIRVTDTGPGISPEVQQRMFEPFYTTKNRSGAAGTGLGLSTAYGIIRAHKGAIRVQSGLGRGTTFQVYLPAGCIPPRVEAGTPASEPGQGVILLVDDEPVVRELGRSALESLGYEVVTAVDGVDGIEAYRRHESHLRAVLLDLKMPRMGGHETFIEFRKINAEVPVIICTGYGDNEEVQEVLTLGAKGLITKPYRIADLAQALGHCPARIPALGQG